MIRGNFTSPEGGSFKYLCQALRPDMYVLTNNPSFNCQLWLDGNGHILSINDYGRWYLFRWFCYSGWIKTI